MTQRINLALTFLYQYFYFRILFPECIILSTLSKAYFYWTPMFNFTYHLSPFCLFFHLRFFLMFFSGYLLSFDLINIQNKEYYYCRAMKSPYSSQQQRSLSRIYKKQVSGSFLIVKKTPIRSEGDAMACLKEAALLKLCSHPCIVQYRCAYVDPQLVFCLEMECLPGGDLERVVAGGKDERLWRWVFQAACGLHHMHRLGVIHRDVKPDNIALDQHGNAKLIDLGSAIFKRDLQGEGFRLAGSPGYTAPEMILRKEYDEKVDVYALGVCLYQLVHGRRPFAGETARDYWKNTLQEQVQYGSECPAELVALIDKMLRKNPAERITALEVLSIAAANR